MSRGEMLSLRDLHRKAPFLPSSCVIFSATRNKPADKSPSRAQCNGERSPPREGGVLDALGGGIVGIVTNKRGGVGGRPEEFEIDAERTGLGSIEDSNEPVISLTASEG